MTRHDAFKLVDAEREYQDRTYNPDKILSSGLTRAQRDQDVTSHLTMLDSYIRKAADAWTFTQTGDNLPALQQIAKVAAIAIRALEHSGGSDRLLLVGLRSDKGGAA